jgi:hypothetical protein
VNVHLPHLVANAGHVDLIYGKTFLYKGRKCPDAAADGCIVRFAQMVQFGDFGRDLGHQQNPKKMGLIFQQHSTDAVPTEIGRSGGQAFVEEKIAHAAPNSGKSP